MHQFENSRKKVNAMKEEVFQNGEKTLKNAKNHMLKLTRNIYKNLTVEI